MKHIIVFALIRESVSKLLNAASNTIAIQQSRFGLGSITIPK